MKAGSYMALLSYKPVIINLFCFKKRGVGKGPLTWKMQSIIKYANRFRTIFFPQSGPR